MKTRPQTILCALMFALVMLAQSASAFYDASPGRWINRDPLEEEGGINLFGFSGNDPVNNYDPYGESWLSDVCDFFIPPQEPQCGNYRWTTDPMKTGTPAPSGPGGGGFGRGWTGRGGMNNPFKHLRPHPTDPSKVICKHPRTGKDIVKPKPSGYDEWRGKK